MKEVAEAIENISKRRIKTLIKSPVKSAEAVNLVYVNDNQPGIQRVRKGDKFEYSREEKIITDEALCPSDALTLAAEAAR